nr:MAG TPA: Chromatin remodeling complex ATPase [Caudoviricetes sp.]
MKEDVTIRRISNFEYSFRESSQDGKRHVCKALTFTNPDIFAYSRRIQKFDKRRLTFQIGMLRHLTEYLKERDVSYSVFDYNYKLPSGVKIDDRMSGKYIHQRRAVEAFYKRRFGIIKVPTRGGKTFIMSEILRIFLNTDSGNFLFCVDNTTLFKQAVGDIKEFFIRYGGIEVGEIRSGKVDTDKRVTVAMLQTIQATLSQRCMDKDKKKRLQAFLQSLKFLSVDEIHDNFSSSKFKIYRKCKKIDYLLLLSATPYKANTLVQNLNLKSWSGDIIYSISEEELRERGVLSQYKVFEIVIDHNDIDYNISSEEYVDLRNMLIFYSDYRNGVLLKIIDLLTELKLKTLILFQSIEHGSKISELTALPFISGKDKSDKREKEKNAFLKKDGGILLASNIFKKGITLPEAQVLVNVDDGVEDANTVQKKGRVIASTKNKDRSLIIDFIDIYDAYFSEHSETRLNTYVKSVGEENVGIIDSSSPDAMKLLKDWMERWFRLKK